MLSRAERLDLLDWEHIELPLSVQADLLSISRSSLYYKPVPPSEEELELKRRIDEAYTKWPFYGSRRIAAVLNREGLPIGRSAVRRCMREMGLQAIYPGPNLSKRNIQHRVYPYLLKNLPITAPNQVWGIDITYIRMVRGWMYLVAILDWYSRYVIEWELSDSLESNFVVEAVERAFQRVHPGILNSDQGSQFTSDGYIELLKDAGVRISMDGRGRALDNIFTERLWRSLKYEEVYLHEYTNPKEVRHGIARWMSLYNSERPHQSLHNHTPFDVYLGTATAATLCV